MDDWVTADETGAKVSVQAMKYATCHTPDCPGAGACVAIPDTVDIAFCGDCSQQQTITQEVP